MSSNVKPKLRALTKKRNRLQQNLKHLCTQNSQLLIRNALLQFWCDSLDLLRSTMLVKDAEQQLECGGDEPEQGRPPEHLQECLENELLLLRSLDAGSSLDGLDLHTELLHPGVSEPISPAGDPMAFFRRCLTAGQEYKDWDTLDLARNLGSTVLQSSIHLNHVRMGLGQELQAPVQDLWDRCYAASLSLLLHGHQEVCEGLIYYRLDSLSAQPEHRAAAQQRTEALLPFLNLTEQQQDIISMAVDVFEPLWRHVQAQQVDTAAQMAAAAAAAGAEAETEAAAGGTAPVDASAHSSAHASAGADNQPSATLAGCSSSGATAAPCSSVKHTGTDGQPKSSTFVSAGSSGGGCGSSSSSSSDVERRLQNLAKQQQLATRMKALLAKEYLLAMAMVGCCVGCLTYEQLSWAYVGTWPYVVLWFRLALTVRQQRTQELQQRQQH